MLRLRAIKWLPTVAQLDATEVTSEPVSPDPFVVQSVATQAELSPWNLSPWFPRLYPANPQPGREACLLSQCWPCGLFSFPSCEPASLSRGKSLRKCGWKISAPECCLKSWKVQLASSLALGHEALGGELPFPWRGSCQPPSLASGED